MPLDPRVKRFLDAMAAANPPSMREASVDQRRAALVELLKLSGPEIPIVGVEERSIPGPAGRLTVRIYTPRCVDAGPSAGLIYLHGGGLVSGSLDTHDPIARALAQAGACRVVSVDYRLAPEHRFPAALEDALAAVRHVAGRSAEFRIDPSRLGICGDSAGGTLAAAACQTITRSGGASLALQVLICPILDHSRSTASRQAFASGYLLDQATLDHDLRYYLPAGVDTADPRISPLRAADLAGLPPTIVHAAEFDPLRDEAAAYYERLAHAGIALSYTLHSGMIHLFYGLGAVIPYARTAWDQIGSEIRSALIGRERKR